MPKVLYYAIESPACRAVLVTAESIGVKLNLKHIDLATGEHHTPQFLKINPTHTIPTLDDDGVIITDSHAINAYLVSKYGKNDSLYPKDLVKRSLIDSRLHFDSGVAFAILKITYRAHIYDGQTEYLTPWQKQKIIEVYDFINAYLERTKWIAGDELTIADMSLVTTVNSLETMLEIDSGKYSKIRKWLDAANALPAFAINKEGNEAYKNGWLVVSKHHNMVTTTTFYFFYIFHTTNFLQEEGVTVLLWPPRLPDLDHIEHVYDLMRRILTSPVCWLYIVASLIFKMTKPKLYYAHVSPPSRATLLTIAALNLNVELVPMNLSAGEHLSPQFLKKNPLHTVPTLEDGDLVVFDSHAINAYLVTKYGKNDALYPKDPQKRAIIDQRLHFDSSVLAARMGSVIAAILRGGVKVIEKDKADLIVQGYQSLELLLEGHSYVAGNDLSIADFNVVGTISSCNAAIVPIASNTYPRITAWLSRMQNLPYYETNQTGVDQFKDMIHSKIHL
ncbi:uncharacterized protein LOC126745287 [Anthonomus grandis grandis]|uniref:uncharacterized protein LOC126745287 n=1 Tax=Anthonomus grandis grandis TaxID=2921223 RepID=UPI002165CEE8|nr:uncharacterized protein LOC126745287 [Anthonomus grandis grandis]